jgi:hypothetical protein
MKNSEYIFKHNNVINVIQLKPSANSKIGFGYIVQTYHFSPDQFNDFKADSLNCLGCPFSFSSKTELSGKCYTHKGMQRWGLNSMLKKLSKLDINEFNSDKFDALMAKVKIVNPSLVRFGAYGEPTLLPMYVVEQLTKYNHTGYTHAWRKFPQFSGIFQASVHSLVELAQANKLGYKTFRIADVKERSEALCPASKEAGKKKTCVECRMCNGAMKNVVIAQH